MDPPTTTPPSSLAQPLIDSLVELVKFGGHEVAAEHGGHQGDEGEEGAGLCVRGCSSHKCGMMGGGGRTVYTQMGVEGCVAISALNVSIQAWLFDRRSAFVCIFRHRPQETNPSITA